MHNDRFIVYNISSHPSGCVSGGLSVCPSIHPPQIIHPSHPDSLLYICLPISICIYMSECPFISVSLPLYPFICLGIYLSLYMSVCLPLRQYRPLRPRVLPFPGCIMFINVGLKYDYTRTERTHSTFPPVGSETTIPLLDRYSHRLLDRMHRQFFSPVRMKYQENSR
jgi:hypothetical protein